MLSVDKALKLRYGDRVEVERSGDTGTVLSVEPRDDEVLVKVDLDGGGSWTFNNFELDRLPGARRRSGSGTKRKRSYTSRSKPLGRAKKRRTLTRLRRAGTKKRGHGVMRASHPKKKHLCAECPREVRPVRNVGGAVFYPDLCERCAKEAYERMEARHRLPTDSSDYPGDY